MMLETAQPLFATSRRYRGGCQCGCVVYEASLDLRSTHVVEARGCSAREQEWAPSVWEHRACGFKLMRGEEALCGFQFSDDGVHHFYCESCGARAFTHVSTPECGEFYSVDLKSLHVSAR